MHRMWITLACSTAVEPERLRLASAVLLAGVLEGCTAAKIDIITPPSSEPVPALSCEAIRGNVRCTRTHLPAGGTERAQLGVSGRDLLDATAFGWNVCAISRKHGFRCLNLHDRRLTGAKNPARMDRRTTVVWDRGICVEMQRVGDLSSFECFVQSAGTTQEIEFWVSSRHQVAAFSSGACVCSDAKKGLTSPREEIPTGAACVLTGDDIPLERDQRAADVATKVALVRGPWGSGDFAFVCDRVVEESKEDAASRLEGWSNGSVPLPARRHLQGKKLARPRLAC